MPGKVAVLAQIIAAENAMEAALALLGEGEVVAIPTETVYGLAADATNGVGVARIFEAKGRPRFNPLISHVCNLAMAERIGVFDPISRNLVEKFWPGPLTLVLPLRPEAGIHPLATAELDTVAMRMPRGFAADLIARFGRPLAAPSANASGRISPTSAAAVAASLGERISLVVDGGSTAIGLESTIVKVEGGQVWLLRPGGITADDIEAAIGIRPTRPAAGGIQAPGMMASHYAPGAAVRLAARHVEVGEALLAFGPVRAEGWDKAVAVKNLSEAGDLRQAASNLFAYLRDMDEVGAAVIAVEPVPFEGLGEAINDRLARAAAPRDAVSAMQVAP